MHFLEFRARLTRRSSSWKHWGCVSKKVLANVKENFSSASELDVYEDMTEEDKEKIDTAYEVGHVADEDIPESAKKPTEDEDEDKPKKKPAKRTTKKVLFFCPSYCYSQRTEG